MHRCLSDKPAAKLILRRWAAPLHYRRLALSATLPHPFSACRTHTYTNFNTKLKHYTNYRAHSSLPNYLQKSLAKNIRFHCLQPIFSSSPPWTFTKPVINLQLMELPKKTTSPTTFRERFQSLINKHPNTNICYTDGSKTNNRTGLTYSINNSCTRNAIVTSRQFLLQNSRQFTSLYNISSSTCFPPPTNYYRFRLSSSTHCHQQTNLNHPLVTQINILLHTCTKEK